MSQQDELVKPFLYGNSHMHYNGQGPCAICEAENAAFMRLLDEDGEKLERKVQKLQSTKEYNQRFPYDQYAQVGQLEGVYIEQGESVFDTPPQVEPQDEYADKEAAEELLAPLTPTQREIMRKTAAGYKAREIAAEKGHKNSATVRIGKYKAKRVLGVPVNKRMRRVKNDA
jgi:DNA-binding CsgD family transcriptional regulator